MLNFVPQSNHMKQRRKTTSATSLDAAEAQVRLLEARQEKVIARAFFAFVVACRSQPVVKEFKELYKRGSYVKILDITDRQIEEFAQSSKQVFLNAANWQTGDIVDQLGMEKSFAKAEPDVGVSFNPGNPAAARAMETQALNMIREISESQRDTIRRVLGDALNEGVGFEEAARRFRQNIGLTSHQMGSVANYRRMLETGNGEALNRVLRDRRFDRTIENAINRNAQLTKEQIDRMVQRYQERMLAMRAETIARTESLTALNSGRHEAMEQMTRQLGLEGRIERTWRGAMDARIRDTHRAMNGQRRGEKEAFVSPSGVKLMFPGDPTARADERINCRCVVLIRIKDISEMITDQGAAAVIAQMPKTKIPGTGLDTSIFVRHPTKDYHIPASSVDAPRLSGLDISDFRKPKADDWSDTFFKMSQDSLKQELSYMEARSIQAYSTYEHKVINKFEIDKRLRDPDSVIGTRQVAADKHIKNLDSAFDKVELSDSIVVYRGAGTKVRFDQRFPNLKVGEYIVVDPAYASTSLSKDMALSFLETGEGVGSKGMLYEILLPKGSKVLPMGDKTKYIDEMEYLINRNSKFVVRKVTSNVVTLELLLT